MDDFSNINSNLYKIIKEFNIGKIQQTQLVIEIWDDIVGDIVAKNTKPLKFINGMLYVEVSNSSWLNQIPFIKEDIIQKYRLKLNKSLVKDIKFSMINNQGSPLPPTLKMKDPKKISDNKIFLIKDLPEEDKKLIEKNSEFIEDETLKNSLKKLFEYSRKKELTLLKEGWKKCSDCGALHNNKGELCNYCDIKD